MLRFLFSFFSLYGLMHLYLFLRVRSLFAPGIRRILAGILFVAMVLAPVLVRVVERLNLEALAIGIAWCGYCWMGFAFLLVVILGCVDLLRLLAWIFARCGIVVPFLQVFSDRNRALGAVLLAAGCALYGGYEAMQIRPEQVTLYSAKLPADSTGIRIVQLSDVHLGLMIGEKRLRRMLAVVVAARPDVLVATGDMVDGQVHRLNGLSQQFLAITPRYGRFAVTGNHEYYAGLPQSLDFLRRCGFRTLRRETVNVAGVLTIAGVDDPAGARWGDSARSDEQGLLPAGPDRPYTILLKHRPAVAGDSRGRFDLQLSGHVHKGQIFPFNALTYLFFPVRAGLNRLPDGSSLYVSRGTGTWGPPIRFLAPPEVTIIDLLPLPRH